MIGTGVEITSSLETAKGKCDAGELGMIVKKRLGVGNFAQIRSLGPLQVGSVFSNMANLPNLTGIVDQSLDAFVAAIENAEKQREKVTKIEC